MCARSVCGSGCALCVMRLARGGVRGIQDGGGQWEFLPFGADRGGQSEDLSLCMCRGAH